MDPLLWPSLHRREVGKVQAHRPEKRRAARIDRTALFQLISSPSCRVRPVPLAPAEVAEAAEAAVVVEAVAAPAQLPAAEVPAAGCRAAEPDGWYPASQ